MEENKRLRWKWAILLGVLCLDAKIQAAESTEPNSVTEAKASKVETIQVTGSRLRRTDVETAAPVTVVDREAIEKSGVVSIGDIFRKSASSSPTGNFSGASGFVDAGYSTIDLLGLGASRTLVLLNGKRLPVVAGIEAVNVDNIPISIIERVEILSGGASAVYGADAVGGVVNFVTKKEFEGTEIAFFTSQPQHKGGAEYEFTATQGAQINDTVSLLLSGGIRKREPINKQNRKLSYALKADRRYTSTNPTTGSWSYRPIIGTDPATATFGNWTPSANCPTDKQMATVPTQPQNIYCVGLRSDFPEELMPKKEEKFISALATYEISSQWKASLNTLFHNSSNPGTASRFNRLATDPISGSPLVLTRAKAIELGVMSADVAGDYVQVFTPLSDEPLRSYINSNQALTAIASLDGELNNGWNVQSSLTYSQIKAKRLGKNIFNSETLSGLLYNKDNAFGADPTYIPLDSNRKQADLLAAYTDLRSESFNDLVSVDTFAGSKGFVLPGGDISYGFGGSFAAESFKQTADPRDREFNSLQEPLYTGTFANKGHGKRQTLSLYTEAVAPITESLRAEGALRFDHYNDFGDTINFGLGTKVATLSWLSLRARAASSFQAPPLTYIHQEGGGGYLSVKDTKYCEREIAKNRYCDPSDPTRSVYVNSPGNKNLKPETGLNYTAGFIFEPLPGLSLISDYYRVSLKKTFESDEIQEVVDAWYRDHVGDKLGGQVGDNTVAVDQDGIVSTVGLPVRNLGEIEVRAIVSNLNYRSKIMGLGLTWESQYFRMLSYKLQETDAKPLRQQVGYFGIPSWRLSHQLGVGFGIHNVSVSARSISRQSQDPENATAESLGSRVGSYNEYDLGYATELPWSGSLQLGVNNILDTIGGVSSANLLGSEDLVSTSLYSYTGRAFYARISQRF